MAPTSHVNLDDFQSLMYRPLYWFGQVENPSPTFDERLSLAYAPTSSNGGRTVVIRLKGWRFSNGQRVDAQSVIFWMNMLEAEPSQWAGSPGEFPYNVVELLGTRRSPRRDRDDHLRQALLDPVAPLQRAVADHADARGLGHHLA